MVLFEPTMALRFGTRKKLDAVLDLKQMFKSIVTMPPTGITQDSDWIDLQQLPDFELLFAEVCAFKLSTLHSFKVHILMY